MEKEKNRRKISEFRTLNKRYIKHIRKEINKFQVGPFVQVRPKEKRKERKMKKVLEGAQTFQLAIVKIPWYKKLRRFIFGNYRILLLK